MTPPIREMTARDRGFVVDTWAHDARKAYSRYLGKRGLDASFRMVDGILARGARVLCIATDERTVHAWVAGQGNVLHFAYTAPELREKGFARHLLVQMFGERGPELRSHESPRWLAKRAQYNPYLIAFEGEREVA